MSTFAQPYGYQTTQSQPHVATQGDRAVAVWYRDYSFSYLGWGYSVDGGQSWTDGGTLPVIGTDWMNWTATVCADRSGSFYVADQCTSPRLGGHTVAVWRGSFQGTSMVWQQPVFALPPLNEGYPTYHRPWLVCDPDRGYLYLTYMRMVQAPNYVFEGSVYFVRSLDGGATWSAPQALSNVAAHGAQPAVGPGGELYVVWHDYAAARIVARKSLDFGASFGPTFTVAPVLDNLSTPPLGWHDGGFSPGVPFVGGGDADFPSVAVDRSSGVRRGTVYVTWTDYAEGALGPVGGAVYESEPNNDFAGATPFQLGEEIQGFQQSVDFGGGDDDYFTFEATAGTTLQISGKLTCAYPPNFDSSPINASYWVGCVGAGTMWEQWAGSPPPMIYTFPVTGRYYLGIGVGTKSYCYSISTRLLTPSPGQAAQDHRDVVLVSSSDGGSTWSGKRRVNDDPPRFDNSFPSVAVDDLGQAHVAWYDRRDDPGCGGYALTYWTASLDGGVTFLPSQPVSREPSTWFYSDNANGPDIGDHLGLATSGARAWLVWTDTRGVDADIYGATVLLEPPTAVAVSGLRGEAASGVVRLSWRASDAAGIAGFQVHRAQAAEAEVPLGAVQPVRGEGSYEFDDADVTAGGRYRYRLEVKRSGTASVWLGPVDVELPLAIHQFAWQEAVPNPFREGVTLALALPRSGTVSARVYDLLGHEVATLRQGPVEAGVQRLAWDGRDRSGRRVPPGIYLLRAALGGETATRRVISIR